MSNRLSREHSPYLLQHADNPVDWRPWGPEVFEEARRADKPVFLSIGYSTCHWCHVMAHESFEDETVVQAINGAYCVSTYLPKAQLLRLLHEAVRLWREDREGVLATGETLTIHLRQEAFLIRGSLIQAR